MTISPALGAAFPQQLYAWFLHSYLQIAQNAVAIRGTDRHRIRGI
jgi:hypothetical protein